MRQQTALNAILEPAIAALGYELWGYELNGHSLLRIYIDSSQGVTLDDCSKVTRHISDVLDVEDVLPENYSLEVSSPGIERTLFKEEHFSRYQGKPIKVQLTELVEGHRQMQAVIKTVSTDALTLTVDDNDIVVPWNLVEKAKLVE